MNLSCLWKSWLLVSVGVAVGCQPPANTGTIRTSRIEIVNKAGKVVGIVEADEKNGGASIYLGEGWDRTKAGTDPNHVIIASGEKSGGISMGDPKSGRSTLIDNRDGIFVQHGTQVSTFPARE